jgi:hypothetical protein
LAELRDTRAAYDDDDDASSPVSPSRARRCVGHCWRISIALLQSIRCSHGAIVAAYVNGRNVRVRANDVDESPIGGQDWRTPTPQCLLRKRPRHMLNARNDELWALCTHTRTRTHHITITAFKYLRSSSGKQAHTRAAAAIIVVELPTVYSVDDDFDDGTVCLAVGNPNHSALMTTLASPTNP